MNKKRYKRLLLILGLGIPGLLVIGFAVLLLVSGIFTRQMYLEPWEQSYAGGFEDPRIRLSAQGLLAPSGHNMQPWLVKLDPFNPAVFELYADSSRLTPEVDPEARQFMITQGTFLEYLSTAAEQSGYRAEMQLFPGGMYDEQNLAESMARKPVARITLVQQAPVNSPLYPYLFRSDTNRGAYETKPLTVQQQQQLAEINTDKELSVQIYQNAADLERIRAYAGEAAVIEAGTRRVMQESEHIFRSNEREKNRYRYGYSVEGQGGSGIMKHLLQGAVTLFPALNQGQAAVDQFIKSANNSLEHTSAYAMIRSSSNSRLAQVKSGMLYSRLVLTAHRLGLVMQPLSQALEEYPEMEGTYNSIHHSYAPGGETIQMLFRVGTPLSGAPLSMRRDVMQIIAAPVRGQ